MIIDYGAFERALRGILDINHKTEEQVYKATSTAINATYSNASGFDQIGEIHGNSLRSAPGSAASVLIDLARDLDQILLALRKTNHLIQTQDIVSSLGFGELSTRKFTSRTEHFLPSRLSSGNDPLYKRLIATLPNTSLHKLAMDLQNSKSGDLLAAQRTWVGLENAMENVSDELLSAAGEISATCEGELASSIINRLNRLADRSQVISRNASVFHRLSGDLHEMRSTLTATVGIARNEVDALKAMGPSEAVAAQTLETMLLSYFAATSQAALIGLIPPVYNLTLPDTANPGANITTGLHSVDAHGSQYSAHGVTMPQGLADTVLDFAAQNPHSAAVINAVTRDMADAAGIDIGEGLLSPAAINTHSATVGAPSADGKLTSHPSISSHLSPNTTTASYSPDLNTLFHPGTPMTRITGGHQGTPPHQIKDLLRAGQSGIGAAALQAHLKAGMATNTGAFNHVNRQAELNSALRAHPVSSHSSQTWNSRPGLSYLPGNNPSSSTAPFNGHAQENESTRRFGAHGLNSGSGNGAHTSEHPRSSMPAHTSTPSAGRTGKEKKGKVRTVTSSIEHEGNLRALLGEKKPVVPGVISGWVREDQE